MLGDPSALALVPLVLVLLLLVRAVPAVALRRRLDTRQQVAAGLLLATSLPFLLVAAEIGQNAGVLTAAQAGARVRAGWDCMDQPNRGDLSRILRLGHPSGDVDRAKPRVWDELRD